MTSTVDWLMQGILDSLEEEIYEKTSLYMSYCIILQLAKAYMIKSDLIHFITRQIVVEISDLFVLFFSKLM